MRRRAFLLAGLALGAGTQLALAQGLARIGFISSTARGPRDRAFLEGLREHGYVPDKNVAVELRFADGKRDRFPALIEELIALKVDVLVVGSTIGARAAKAATSTIPIVFAGSSDPVAGGLVTDLARPGGNITGLSLAYGDSFAGKWLELLREAAPKVTKVAALWSSSNAAAVGYLEELKRAAATLGIALVPHHAAVADELEAALAAVAGSNAQGLIVMPSPFAVASRAKLAAFASKQALPAVYFSDSFVKAGGLMSYGPSIPDAYRRAAGYVHRILRGARPGDLPVERPTRFELVINRAAARALGLSLPQSILLRADRVVE